jgi:hypothetical protein
MRNAFSADATESPDATRQRSYTGAFGYVAFVFAGPPACSRTQAPTVLFDAPTCHAAAAQDILSGAQTLS